MGEGMTLAGLNLDGPILARIAGLLDRSREERRVAARILKDIFDRDAARDKHRDSWEWQLAFACMAIGSCDEALRLFGNASLAVAEWLAGRDARAHARLNAAEATWLRRTPWLIPEANEVAECA